MPGLASPLVSAAIFPSNILEIALRIRSAAFRPSAFASRSNFFKSASSIRTDVPLSIPHCTTLWFFVKSYFLTSSKNLVKPALDFRRRITEKSTCLSFSPALDNKTLRQSITITTSLYSRVIAVCRRPLLRLRASMLHMLDQFLPVARYRRLKKFDRSAGSKGMIDLDVPDFATWQKQLGFAGFAVCRDVFVDDDGCDALRYHRAPAGHFASAVPDSKPMTKPCRNTFASGSVSKPPCRTGLPSTVIRYLPSIGDFSISAL